ncbi:DNA recombination protein RmuC [Alteromonas sediminis]|uniref:DNA recombination protein RmuC n=2 Tax=Alteromonas sediminis TaxID=2259342 RepID=A0A3N5Y2P5_9ALTE|nr:DNA recombination protein RmuC [Alteromonas sediminis]RPJ67323.1 DNA recombination protein RmuC [Alteromonas sediminis]
MPELSQALLLAMLVGALLGAGSMAIILLVQRKKHTQQIVTMEGQQQLLSEQVLSLTEKAALLPEITRQRDNLQQALLEQQQAFAQLNARSEADKASFAQQAQANDEKLALMHATEKRLAEQFENLANRIFEQKSESFTKLNRTGMDALIGPLKEQLEAFKRQINDQSVREGQERASLKTEILSLKALNQRITEEAAALTMALKGDNKKQGNWGEVVLERILSESGLREGHEFNTQVSVTSDEGKQQQPDVVVHLPNDKDVVIDSKVSLSAYERYFNSDDEDERAVYLKEHVASLKNHIKGLSKKDYQSLPGLKTLDYVLMFVPVEPAFLLAIDNDPDLVGFALSQNIMLVSPTNLLVALRTINNIWQYEYQNQNAQKIATHGAKLYDKFTGFIADMEKLGKTIDTTQKHFDSAFNKLSQGRGNIVRQIEQFRELGVQPNKRLPNELVSDEDVTSVEHSVADKDDA